jgi:hypothetical protein
MESPVLLMKVVSHQIPVGMFVTQVPNPHVLRLPSPTVAKVGPSKAILQVSVREVVVFLNPSLLEHLFNLSNMLNEN